MKLVVCFDLDYDLVIHHQIEALNTEQFPFVNNPDSKLSFDVMPALLQLTFECQDVQALQKPESERVVNLKNAPMIDRVRCSSSSPFVSIPASNQQFPKTNHRIDAPGDPTDATTHPPLSGVIPEIRVP